MVRLINGWTKADVLERFQAELSDIERSSEMLVTPDGKCCAIGALLPDDARAALRDWRKVAKLYGETEEDTAPTGLPVVAPYLDAAAPGWRERVPFPLIDCEPDRPSWLDDSWTQLMSSFDLAHTSAFTPFQAAETWAIVNITE